jgi:HEAT repeat protein
MHALIGSAALLFLFAAPGQSRAPAEIAAGVQPPAHVRAQVESYLGSVDTPVTPAQWKALGPEGAQVLEQIAQDQKKLPTRRARAVSALAIVGAPGASQLAIDLAQRESEKSVVRMSAVRAAGQLLDPAALMTAMKPVLERATDLHVRAATAEVLTARAPKEACALVRAQSAHEKPDTRPAFARALKTCDPLPTRP